MATHESALKAHRQSLKNREHNRQARSRLRSALKSIRAAVDSNDLAGARTALKQTMGRLLTALGLPVQSHAKNTATMQAAFPAMAYWDFSDFLIFLRLLFHATRMPSSLRRPL